MIDSTKQLVIAARGGDREAFGFLFEMFRGMVWNVALKRLKNPDNVDDVVQNVFLRAWKCLPKLGDPEFFPGWIKRIGVNMAINFLRRGQRRHAEVFVGYDAEDGSTEPIEDMIAGELHGSLRAAVDRLKDADAQVVRAFYLEGKSMKSICRENCEPMGTIKRRLHHARHRLRDVLLADPYFSDCAVCTVDSKKEVI